MGLYHMRNWVSDLVDRLAWSVETRLVPFEFRSLVALVKAIVVQHLSICALAWGLGALHVDQLLRVTVWSRCSFRDDVFAGHSDGGIVAELSLLRVTVTLEWNIGDALGLNYSWHFTHKGQRFCKCVEIFWVLVPLKFIEVKVSAGAGMVIFEYMMMSWMSVQVTRVAVEWLTIDAPWLTHAFDSSF